MVLILLSFKLVCVLLRSCVVCVVIVVGIVLFFVFLMRLFCVCWCLFEGGNVCLLCCLLWLLCFGFGVGRRTSTFASAHYLTVNEYANMC